MVVLDRPSYVDTPKNTGWGLSQVEWLALQAVRKQFKGLPFSDTPYTRYNGLLDEREMRAFCAAGYFLWRLGDKGSEVLMIWEDRKGRRLLNFLGGNRDNAQESPITVAARETTEETGFLLSATTLLAMQQATDKTVVWLPESKYALFVQELTGQSDKDIQQHFALLPKGPEGGPLGMLTHGGDPGIVGLEWVGARDLFDNDASNFHPFTRTMIKNLIKSGILPTA